jgi:long-chain acyl-CoA synthetase
MAVPGAETLIARLAAMSGLERSILPSDHLELDLGLDTLARVELEVVLEREFGLKISPEEAPRITTVRDLLMRLSTPGSGSPEQAPWSRILRERISPPLAEVFRLQGRPMEKGFVECVRRTAGAAARLAFSLEVRGLERLPPAGPYLLCPTHASLLDAVLIFMALPRSHVQRLFFLGAREYFKSPFMRWVARVGRVISTGTADTLLVSLRRAAEALETGMSVCIFPEGAITRDGYLQRPRPGAGILACERRVPIVPVLMRGTYDTFSFRHPGLHFRPLGITIGDPIAPPLKPECGSADYAAMAGAWHRAILRLRAEDNASGSRTSGRSPLIPEEAAPPFSAATGDATSGPEIP